MICLLIGGKAQEMESLRMGWMFAENVLVQLLGLRKPTGLMVGYGLRQERVDPLG